MVKKTHNNPFTKQEIEDLRKNPNVASVTAYTIRYTEEFKKLVYENKLKGISVTKTLINNGIDPAVLG